jgi:hypothetical protein
MLTFSFQPTAQLTPDDLDELWAVYSQAFQTERALFEAGVRTADEVVRYREGQRLRGLGLVSTFEQRHAGRRLRVVWTGSVVISPELRGHNAIQRAGLVHIARERLRHPLTPLYWFFDTFSYKSYLLLARNFREFWPRPDAPTPDWEAGLLRALCEARAGTHFDARTGIIAARGKRLRPGVAEAPALSADPHLAFFARANPRAAEGECLACLAPLDAPNLARIASRMATRALRRLRDARPPEESVLREGQ